MTLESLAYLAEIIGAGLVVASLIYVGRQLRQNTETMRQNAAGYYLALQDRLMGEVANSRELAEYWCKGQAEFGSLDEVDRQRMMLFEQRAIAGKEGLVPDSQWNELLWSVKHFGSRQSAHASWEIFKSSYGQPFQDFVSEHMTDRSAIAN